MRTSGRSRRALPVWSGEIYLELHRGTLTTQSGVKRKHRQAERALITAETVGSLAHLLGGAAPHSLEPHWRVVLKNEFHDILPGSSIREVYVDAERELDGAIAAGKAAQEVAMAAIAAQLPKGDRGRLSRRQSDRRRPAHRYRRRGRRAAFERSRCAPR